MTYTIAHIAHRFGHSANIFGCSMNEYRHMKYRFHFCLWNKFTDGRNSMQYWWIQYGNIYSSLHNILSTKVHGFQLNIVVIVEKITYHCIANTCIIHLTLHCHYIALHFMTSSYIALHKITLPCIVLLTFLI